MTLNDLLPDLLGRLEENIEAGAPIFWSQTYELLPELVDSMFEAALITGVVQAVNISVTLAANTTYFSLGKGSSFGGGNYTGATGVPVGVIAALRMRAPWTIRKVSLKGLGDVVPGWENTTPAQQIRAWFPLGVSAFGIWPQFSVESSVVMDFIVSPVNQGRPYTPAIPVSFQEEFTDGFSQGAAVMLRAKELSAEAEESETIMNAYLDKMKSLSMFQNRLDSLVFTQSSGAKATVNRKEIL